VTLQTFADLGLPEPILRALAEANYHTPTPIQAQSIPALLEGRDMLGIAQTGTGKTAAFALPMLRRLADPRHKPAPKSARALVLAPTRELAIQISDSVRTYARHLGLRQAVIYGGVGENNQIRAMTHGVDVLIATPGRLLDLANRRFIRLDQVKFLVLDEADRMLDMGFIRDVNKIVAMIPAERQSLLFSATMPNEIAHLAAKILRDPARVEVTPKVVTVERIEQTVHHVAAGDKRALLVKLFTNADLSRVIVFTRTKHGANKVAETLQKAGILADAIHGNKSQNARQRALAEFKSGKIRALVATDIAARGIDVQNITHVVNFELPNIPETYVHRIGRTARAGGAGAAISFCDGSERPYLKDIEKLIRRQLTAVDVGPLPAREAHPAGRPHGQTRSGHHGHGQQRHDSQRQGHQKKGQQRGHGHGQGQTPRRDEGGHHGQNPGKKHHDGARHDGHRQGYRQGGQPQRRAA
jgi:ATP-dependent RNA helicase RhlE